MKLAQIDFNALINTSTPGLPNPTVGTIINALLIYIIPFAGLVLLLYLISGGFKYMLSQGDPGKVKIAQGTITNALAGFALVFFAYWIVKFVALFFGLNRVTDIF